MQQITETLAAHLAGEVTTLATCWRIARRDGMQHYFTDHDRDITVDGHQYSARTGIVPSAVTSQAGLAVDNLELEGLLDSETITRAMRCWQVFTTTPSLRSSW